MAEKTLNTRILLKYDTIANWTAETNQTNILKKGEVALVEIPTGNNNSTSPPAVLMKVGDGTTAFNNLKWFQAHAADVHAWAKKSEDQFKAWVQTLPVFTISDDNVVNLSYAAGADGIYKLEGTHAKKGPSTSGSTTKGATADVTISGAGSSGSIKVPKATVDEYGHVTGLTEQTLSITIPASVADHNQTVTANGVSFSADDAINFKANGTLLEVTADSTDNYIQYSINENNLKALIGTETTAAMTFKGTLASATAIPANPNHGDMYKTIATFTFTATQDAQGAGFTVKTGDCVVADSNKKWYYIPSGDDIEDTWRPLQVKASGIAAADTINFVDGNHTTVVKGASTGGVTTIQYNHNAPGTGSAATASAGSGRTYVTEVLKDSYGHITGVKTSTETVTDTHYTAGLKVGASATAQTNATTTGNTDTYLNLIENSAVRDSHQIKGSGTVTVASANGVITITGSAHPTSSGSATIASVSGDIVTLKAGATLSNHTLSNSSGDDITLAKVAKTGNLYDIVNPTSGNVVIFDCGSASTVW